MLRCSSLQLYLTALHCFALAACHPGLLWVLQARGAGRALTRRTHAGGRPGHTRAWLASKGDARDSNHHLHLPSTSTSLNRHASQCAHRLVPCVLQHLCVPATPQEYARQVKQRERQRRVDQRRAQERARKERERRIAMQRRRTSRGYVLPQPPSGRRFTTASFRRNIASSSPSSPTTSVATRRFDSRKSSSSMFFDPRAPRSGGTPSSVASRRQRGARGGAGSRASMLSRR